MKRKQPIRKAFTALLAALPLSGALSFGAAAQTAFPATGEQTEALPYILGAVGLIAVILLVVVMILEQKKKNSSRTSPDAPATGEEQPTDPSADDSRHQNTKE